MPVTQVSGEKAFAQTPRQFVMNHIGAHRLLCKKQADLSLLPDIKPDWHLALIGYA